MGVAESQSSPQVLTDLTFVKDRILITIAAKGCQICSLVHERHRVRGTLKRCMLKMPNTRCNTLPNANTYLGM